jgi:hypothetical protein
VKTANAKIKDTVSAKPKVQIVTYTTKPALTGGERSAALKAYLTKRNSYLANHTDLLVQLSDQYGIDYRIVVAISGVESSYCQVNFRPYNCWGYGRFSWGSEEEGIRGYFEQMNKGYFSQGRTTVETIAAKYNPWPENWTTKVYKHMNLI